MIKDIILFFLLILFSENCLGNNVTFKLVQNDSINIWINNSRNKKLEVNDKKKLLFKAYQNISNYNLNKPLELSSIAYEYYKLKDTSLFKEVNNKAIKTSRKQKNYYALGDAYWNFATYYVRKQNYPKAYYHFNKGYDAFDKGGHKYEKGRMLFGMAHIKGRYRDYYGGENLTIKAIEIFKLLNKNKDLYISYNQLALLQVDVKEYDKALFYYNKSLDYFSKVKDKKNVYLGSYNNIGNIFRERGNYKDAIKTYKKDLDKKIKPLHYATLIDNIAYTKLLLKDTTELEKSFFKALTIRDSLGNKTAILASNIHISDYYKYIKDTIKAIHYAKKANNLAKELKNGSEYLTSLKQLANLDKQNSKKYLDRYIEFNDSLISAERRIQNKFTRIEFETDEYIEETERLSQQRIWIIVTSFAGLLVLSLLYFLRVQKVRNEKLKLEAEQQKANEEVYVLTLQQQAKLEEERVNERNRISAELHDGVLGKLFGTRVNLGFLAMQMKPETQEKHQAFLDELQEIEKEIRDVSHRLSDNFDSANINFTTILTQLLKDRSTIGNFSYQFDFDKTIPWSEISEVTKANVYRIIQEALQNIIKHAKAKNVILDVSFNKKELIISLKDDGIGFNTEKKKKGIGIKNITARVKKLGGNLEFISKENQGTTLVIITPFNATNGKQKV
ncbi:tetratricopeptide repeat-containing sensor histidine kinase [Tenacibaculum discolor]|uniref:tetratricopeptide repeat-containing sensor histidine kinase n=1 Tax=Tenacibaculum discolor TaxID=361581 RepID=UPI000EAB76B9|nr:tetratricopeptide repeat-containing sensor histidine kinase [Tenacibaculum discolor]RLJ99689.1 histidine kinase/DNA gyrase B/HSP90-like ATPase [Tenacibaculum discolor]